MGIAHLCDHRAVVYRAEEVRDQFNDVIQVWGALTAPDGLNCRPNQAWAGDLQDPGAGELQGAKRQWFLVEGFDVEERDVLRILSGPEAPDQLRVVSVTRPTNPAVVHHLEVNVEPFTGALEEEGGS